MLSPRRIWIAALAAGLIAGAALAAEFHIAPEGTPAGDGSRGKPWDLATALKPPRAVQPGDTLWLHGGTYHGGFTSELRGTAEAPITLRQAPGERATIDCAKVAGVDGAALFTVNGAHAVYWGFEVTCSGPTRITHEKGSAPADIARGGVNVFGSHLRFINLVVHDTAQGFGFWSNGTGGEICGCLIYANGWIGPDRGHGHAIYTQNKDGTKRLVDNIMFNQCSYGIHAYGSKAAFLDGFEIEGNVAFNNGSIAGKDSRNPGILVGGGRPAARIRVVDNFLYSDRPTTALLLGYGAANQDVVVKGNHIIGSVGIRDWAQVEFTGNTVIAPGGGLLDVQTPRDVERPAYALDGNTYYGAGPTPFVWTAAGRSAPLGWDAWRQAGYDAHGKCERGQPTGTAVFVRPNRYEPGRGHVIIFSWGRQDTVAVDLAAVLKPGQKYRVVNAQDFFGPPVAQGAFDGKPVALPMAGIKPPAPVGMPDNPAPVTGPVFQVFVVLPG